MCGVGVAAVLLSGCGVFGADSYSLAEELHYLPDPPDAQTTLVLAVDITAVEEIFGERPGREVFSDQDDVEAASHDWLARVHGYGDVGEDAPTLGPYFPPYIQQQMNARGPSQGLEQDTGFSLTDIDRGMGVVGHNVREVYEGEDLQERITSALGDPEEAVWELADDLHITQADGRFLLRDGDLAEDQLEGDDLAMIADDPEALAVAESLDELDWYTAQMMHLDVDQESDQDYEYNWWGHSFAVEGSDGDYTYIVHQVWYYFDADEAEDSISRWGSEFMELREQLGITDFEADADGQVVTVRIEMDEPHTVVQQQVNTFDWPY